MLYLFTEVFLLLFLVNFFFLDSIHHTIYVAVHILVLLSMEKKKYRFIDHIWCKKEKQLGLRTNLTRRLEDSEAVGIKNSAIVEKYLRVKTP